MAKTQVHPLHLKNTKNFLISEKMQKTVLYALVISALLGFQGCGRNSDNIDNQDNGNSDNPIDTANSYRNPVFEPDLADPTFIKTDEGWFYAYGTENTWDNNVHHVTPVVRSKDLVNWEFVRDAFDSKPLWKDGGIWAPAITRLNGSFCLYYAYSTWGDKNPGIGMAISSTPEGPFTDQGKVFDSNMMGVVNSIDPSVFSYNDKNYLIWGSLGGGIYGVELSSDGKTTVGEKFHIAGNSFEAAYIYSRDNYFYLFLSTASCCEGANSVYRVVAGRSDNFRGPYYTESGKALLLYNNSWYEPYVDKIEGVVLAGNLKIAGPGHNGQILKDDNGNEWFTYHAILRSNPILPDGATRRPLFIDRIEWKNGWPVINQGKGPSYDYKTKPYFKN
jgi:arabinan endo-1,5-alpha-L-arabinosidase